MHHDTCVTHVPWCMSGSLTRGGGENVPGSPGACPTRDFTYLSRGPCKIHLHFFLTDQLRGVFHDFVEDCEIWSLHYKYIYIYIYIYTYNQNNYAYLTWQLWVTCKRYIEKLRWNYAHHLRGMPMPFAHALQCIATKFIIDDGLWLTVLVEWVYIVSWIECIKKKMQCRIPTHHKTTEAIGYHILSYSSFISVILFIYLVVKGECVFIRI